MRRLHCLTGTVGLAMTLTACGGLSEGGGAETVRLSSYLPQDTALGAAVDAWADQTEQCADGQLEFERFYNGSLYGATDTRDATGDGQVEVGVFSAGYHPGDFPLTQGLFDIPFMSSNVPAVMDAHRTMYEENPAAQAEWNDQGMHMVSMLPVAPVVVGTNVAFDSLEGLDGLNIRGYPAGGVNAAIKAAGGNPVDLELAELPEAMQRGVADGFAGLGMDVATSLSLHENTRYFTEPGLGSTSAISVAANQEWWGSLSEEVRDCASEAAASLNAPYLDAINEVESDACQELRQEGVELSVLPDSEVEEWRGLIQDDQKALWLESAEGAVDDPQAYLSTYQETLQEREEEYSASALGVEGCLEG